MPGFLGGGGSSGGAGGEIRFPKEFIDPVTKLRVSTPENLIDTDFEYGLQPTKWETVELINNTPSFFSKSGDTTIDGIEAITTNAGTREITVKTGLEHGLAVGIPIQVTGTKSTTADGAYIINSIPNPQTFTYLCRDIQPATASIEDLYSSIITGEFFQGSQLRISDANGITTDGAGVSTLTVTTESTHGFRVNTPFYFLNLNSTISQEFQAANTAAKSFDASNSATAQTFDGSNTLSSINLDLSNSAVVGGATSNVASVNTIDETITVTHTGSENFSGRPLGTPVYYDVAAGSGYFAANPRGVVFIKSTSGLATNTSTFQVSEVPDGPAINITGALSGTFQIANQARTFAGNNTDLATQTTLTVLQGTAFNFDGGNQGFSGTEAVTGSTSTANVLGYTGSSILVGITSPATTLDYYVNAMVQYRTTGGAASGLVNNATYFINAITSTGTPGQFNITVKALPNSPSILSPSGGTGTQSFVGIGVSLDKDIIHIRNSNFAKKDMIEYTFPVGGRFGVVAPEESKLFYFVAEAYDSHNYLVNATSDLFTPMVATGGTILPDYQSQGRTYRAHQFTAVGNSTFTIQTLGSDPAIQYLIVGGGGGGGGGGSNQGLSGGGGAGGVRQGTFNAIAQSYTAAVGGGGAGSTASASAGNDGTPSSMFGITASGGGGGGNWWNTARSGASGGGGGNNGGGQSGAAGIAGQGNAGGSGSAYGQATTATAGGGGGGFTSTGGNASGGTGGSGGAGISSSISGVGVTYAGGGGGSATNIIGIGGGNGSGGNGGIGNGGNGQSGPANRGGGGGGGSDRGSSSSTGGAGGSGVVLVRYPLTSAPEPGQRILASGGNFTTSTVGGVTYGVHTFTSSDTFVVSDVSTFAPNNAAQYLIVGGGGSGGGRHGGGGGAGGYISGSRTLTLGSFPVVVGNGGERVEGNGVLGVSGTNSSYGGEVAIGGGGGGVYGDSGAVSQAGRAGGSGGGSGYNTAAGASNQSSVSNGTAFGFAGGGNNSQVVAGGGGGAGGVGGLGSGNGGDGGPGRQWLDGLYYAGGGGGGSWNSGRAGNGGIGGGGGGNRADGGGGSTVGTGGASARNSGGNGSYVTNNGVPALAGSGGDNTGSGGGGGEQSGYLSYRGTSGAGGSGIVIIRYPIVAA